MSNENKTAKAETVSTVRVVREYAEALGVALVLAFIFKAFAIEAYMIPTGSMASTLMGRHKDVNCEVCGYPFQVGSSREVDENGYAGSEQPSVVSGTCPQCNFTMYLGEDNTANRNYMSYNGDRIFVNKYLFDFRKPKRWHVTVFRYPANPYINYIKRLVGVENETLRICHGDIFVKKDSENDFKIQRKPLRALKAMLRPVNDNDYVYVPALKLGYPANWYSGSDDTNSIWTTEDDKSFGTKPAADTQTRWLKYRNVHPSADEWSELLNNQLPNTADLDKPMLVTDFLAYDSELLVSGSWLPPMRSAKIEKDGKSTALQLPPQNARSMGQNWVGDLALSCSLTVQETKGKITLRLTKGGQAFHCEIDPAAGQAEFSIPDVPEFPVFSVPTPINAAGQYEVMFCNIDEQLRLVVNGSEIDLQGRGDYDALCLPESKLSRERKPTAADLEPAAVGVSGGAVVRLEHLKIQRDAYYVSCKDATEDAQCDLIHSPYMRSDLFPPSENGYRKFLMSPERWVEFGKTRVSEFKLGKGQYLMLGDNSLQSKDGRSWTVDGIPFYVEQKFLIGEAVSVYWGHGWRIPGTRLALIPNFPKMRWID
ncbi:MAG: S26 family signal peptidase [Planctomycetaceae bacterium]|jgi:signal peptidase I|nr:S26 family signal peptidase [Planctomycetaceae bacterium]